MELNHHTGGTVSGWDSVLQSIETILSTPHNSRVFRREFGSEVPALTDTPMNDRGLLTLYVAVAEALERWEPRFELTNVQLSPDASGRLVMTLIGNHRPKAHLGDLTSANDNTRTVRMMTDRVENWSLVA